MKTRKDSPFSEKPLFSTFNVSNELSLIRTINGVTALMAIVSRTVPTQDIIEKVALVRAYAEFAIDHPDVTAFRQCLVTSLNRLADALELQGAFELSRKTRSVFPSGATVARPRAASAR
jgi:hypothetical protein